MQMQRPEEAGGLSCGLFCSTTSSFHPTSFLLGMLGTHTADKVIPRMSLWARHPLIPMTKWHGDVYLVEERGRFYWALHYIFQLKIIGEKLTI